MKIGTLKKLKEKEVVENREGKETRSPRPSNPLLRDLIRILILNQLLGGGLFHGRPPMRPPFPGPGPYGRPPFPGQRPRK